VSTYLLTHLVRERGEQLRLVEEDGGHVPLVRRQQLLQPLPHLESGVSTRELHIQQGFQKGA
jgi:hypothetical protein